jgi:hypothetical protein
MRTGGGGCLTTVFHEQGVIRIPQATLPCFIPVAPATAVVGAAGVAAPSSLALLVLPLSAGSGEELAPPTVPSDGSPSGMAAATVEVLRLESVVPAADLKEAVVRGGTGELESSDGGVDEESRATAVAGDDDDDGGATASRLCSETSSTTRPRMNPSRSVLLPKLVANLSFYEFYIIL